MWILDILRPFARLTQSEVPANTYETLELDPASFTLTEDKVKRRQVLSATASAGVTFAAVKAALAAASTAVGFNSQKITGVATPTASTDAANKGYVDGKTWTDLGAPKSVIVARLDITTSDLTAIPGGQTLTFTLPPFAATVPVGTIAHDAYAWQKQWATALTGSGITPTVVGNGSHIAFEYAGTLTVQADAVATSIGITNAIVGTVDWTVQDPTAIPTGYYLQFATPDQAVAVPVAAAVLPGGAAAWLASWNDGRLPSGTVASLTGGKYLTFTRSSALVISEDKIAGLLGFSSAADNLVVNIQATQQAGIRVLAQAGADGGPRRAFAPWAAPSRVPTLSGSCGGCAGTYSVGLALVAGGLAVASSDFKQGGYASLYVSSGVGTQTLATAGTYYKITQFTTAGPTAGDVTASTGASTITVTTAGVYEIAGSLSFTGTNNDTYTIKVHVGGAASTPGAAVKLNSSGDGKEVSIVGRLSLAAGDVVDLRVTADNNTAAFAVVFGQFSVRSV